MGVGLGIPAEKIKSPTWDFSVVLALEQSLSGTTDKDLSCWGHSTCEKASYCSAFLRCVLRCLISPVPIVFASGEVTGKQPPPVISYDHHGPRLVLG
jgi:hypothetical protein